MQALFLGNCLVLSGQANASARDWPQSIQSYAEALSFASDLGQADFWTNLVGITVATSALRGMTQVVESAGDDPFVLKNVSRILSDYMYALPSADVGIRALTAELAARLVAQAHYSARSFDRFGVVVPGRAVAVWRLRRDETFLYKLEQAGGGSHDLELRVELAREVLAYAASEGNDAFRWLPTIIPDAILSGQYVGLQYEALRAATALHEWRLKYGSFPIDVAQSPWFLPGSRLSFQPRDAGKGFRIVVTTGYRAGEVMIEHASAGLH